MVKLTDSELDNLLDSLQEWQEVVGPKELNDNEVGLNSERYSNLVSKLQKMKTELADIDPNMQIHPFNSETCCQHAEGLFDDCFCGWCVSPEGTGPVDLSKVECDTCLERWS